MVVSNEMKKCIEAIKRASVIIKLNSERIRLFVINDEEQLYDIYFNDKNGPGKTNRV